jgi:hypothetical protein
MKTHKSLNLTTIFMYLFLGIVVSFSGFIAFGDEWTAEQKEGKYSQGISNTDFSL